MLFRLPLSLLSALSIFMLSSLILLLREFSILLVRGFSILLVRGFSILLLCGFSILFFLCRLPILLLIAILIGLFLFINTISELVLIQKRQINFNENGTVVASHHIVQDQTFLHHFYELLVHQKIVEPFANASISIFMLNPPPSILPQPRIKFPKGINPPFIEKFLEADPLIGGETWLFVRVGCDVDIDFLVADIEIAADDDAFAFLPEFLAVFLESDFVLMDLVLQPFECLVASTWDVDYHEIEKLVLESEYPALLTVLRLLQVLENRQRLVFGKDGNAGVPGGALAEIPVVIILLNLDFFLSVELGVDFGLVYADEVGVVLGDEVAHGVFAEHAADAVDVPHGQFEFGTCFAAAQDAFVGLLLFQGVGRHFALVELP